MLNVAAVPDYWRSPALALSALLLTFVCVYWPSWQSVVSIWYRSDTFAHGFLVIPASLWLIWSRKDQYRPLVPTPNLSAWLAISGCGFLWLCANLANVLVVEQFALVGLLLSMIWTILGTEFVSASLFPLMFLFFMVPFGEDFVPYLMEFTATFVVEMLKLTRITVVREGLHFTLASGQWSVVEACSGIRYLIASMTLGMIYAYLNYTSYLKRSVFIALSILMPIVANGFRAYMIVMIGHLSSMKLATGVDHVIYGWLFFGLVMLLLFYGGSFWHDEPKPNLAKGPSAAVIGNNSSSQRWVAVSALSMAIVGVWPLTAVALKDLQSIQPSIPEQLLQRVPGIDVSEPQWGWSPSFPGVMAEAKRFVAVDASVNGVYVANFGDESAGGELINSQNVLVNQEESGWRITRQDIVEWQAANQSVSAQASVIKRGNQDLLVFRWYRVGEVNTANRYYAKWLQLLKRLKADSAPELMVVLYTETSALNMPASRSRLERIAAACCS
ncbi:exosortase A [Methylomonas rhizoryzae]|uniref:exosortase A n=1 Tax=Methylomonas rhizoryzae TaxID=2608981 RepID=UPI0012322818|nr:exosortase A [Methylomonas rhizoryzae]